MQSVFVTRLIDFIGAFIVPIILVVVVVMFICLIVVFINGIVSYLMGDKKPFKTLTAREIEFDYSPEIEAISQITPEQRKIIKDFLIDIGIIKE